MLPFFFLLFVLMPIVEIAVLLNVGAAIGWLPTLGIVILTAIVGTIMLRQQGLATLMTARERLNSGQMPAQQLLEGMFLVIGGALLLTPGFVTDAVGFACLLPPTRALMARYLAKRASIGMTTVDLGGSAATDEAGHRFEAGTDQSRAGQRRAQPRPRAGDVIDGEFRRED